MDDNAQTCPHCGCPAPNASARTFMNEDVLHQGKSTDAEAIVSGIAESVLFGAKILSWLGLIFGPIYGTIVCSIKGLPVIILCSIFYFFFIRIIAKVIWGVIMLFVNMSTTLKRIEIKLEENGTR